MPRVCTICHHEKVEEINSALIAGDALRSIAERYSASGTSLLRHKGHLPLQLAAGKEAQAIAQADSLLDQVRSLHGRTLAILARAEEAGQLETCLRAVREARGNLELLLRVDGALKDRSCPAVDLSQLSDSDLEELEVIFERTSVSIQMKNAVRKVEVAGGAAQTSSQNVPKRVEGSDDLAAEFIAK